MRKAEKYHARSCPEIQSYLSRLATLITTTSLIPSCPGIDHIYKSQASFSPTFFGCPRIIVCDGLPVWVKKDDRKRYGDYLERVRELSLVDEHFCGSVVLAADDWLHLSGTVKLALEYVETPFVFLHQHDNVLLKSFDLEGCVSSMLANPLLKHIHLTRYPNSGSRSGPLLTSWDGPVDNFVQGGSLVPLTRCFGWSDYETLTTVQYLREAILPNCGFGFMENFIQPLFKGCLANKTAKERDMVHSHFGTYLYGELNDGCFVRHRNGRERQSDTSNRPEHSA